MLHFLDLHSGSVQAIASIVLVVVTGIYTFLTWFMARAAIDTLRPYVYVDALITSMAQMTVIVGNSGGRVAGDVRVKLTDASNDAIGQAVGEPLANAIGQLAPGVRRRYSIIFKVADLLPKDGPATTLDFAISYRDGARKIGHNQRIDFAGYQQSLFDTDDSPLAVIHDVLVQIEQKMPQPELRGPFGTPCPYCGTSLPRSATKCHACLEWLPGATAPAADNPSSTGEVASSADAERPASASEPDRDKTEHM
jgi:hypothetical protein